MGERWRCLLRHEEGDQNRDQSAPGSESGHELEHLACHLISCGTAGKIGAKYEH